METTVVSLLPWALNEIKPGLIPDTYYVPPSDGVIPSVLLVKDGRSNLYVRDGKTYPVTHSAEEISKAIVNDYCIAQLQATQDAKPALFWVFGSHTAEEIMKKFPKELEEANNSQLIWFMKLVSLADDDWARFGQRRMITDLQRHAAKRLGLVNKPWMQGLEPEEFIKCPACATLTSKNAAICHNCKYVVNPEKAKELRIGV